MLFIKTSNYKLLGHSNIATLIAVRTIFILTETYKLYFLSLQLFTLFTLST